jgi:hypothetical protein
LNNIESQIKNLGYREEPYVGMPLRGMRDYDYYKSPRPGYKMPEYKRPECEKPEYTRPECVESVCSAVDACPLAMAYVPWQQWGPTYKPADAHRRGTIFPELDLPFLGGEC